MAQSNNPQTIKIVIAVVALVIAGIILVNSSKRGSTSNGQYFYDLEAGSLYVAKSGTLAPATAPSGGVGVLAAVFACSTCDDPATHFTGYLTKYSDAYVEVLRSGEPPTMEQMQAGSLIRAVDGDKWVTSRSEAALALVRAAESKCSEDKPATPCAP